MGPEPEVAGQGRGDVGPLTSAVGVIGEIGRTPVPVAESTRHPGERPLASVGGNERGGLDKKSESPIPTQGQRETTRGVGGDHQGGGPKWAMPRPSDPRRPPKGGPGKEEVTHRDTQRRDEGSSEREYPTPDQQLMEADKKRRKKLATLAQRGVGENGI